MIIRYSLLQDWLTCPKHFYDKQVLNKLEIGKSSALEFGTALHLGIKTILNGEDGDEVFLMYWNTLKDVNMTYYGQSWSDLKDLALDVFLPNFKIRHAKKFTDFEQEIKMEMDFIGHTLQGTADLVGLYENKLTVVDWKTSSKSYKKNKIHINSQMYIYAKLYQNKTGKLPEQLVYKVFNKKDGSINTIKKDLTQNYLDAIFIQIESAARGMINTMETKEVYHGADCFCQTI